MSLVILLTLGKTLVDWIEATWRKNIKSSLLPDKIKNLPSCFYNSLCVKIAVEQNNFKSWYNSREVSNDKLGQYEICSTLIKRFHLRIQVATVCHCILKQGRPCEKINERTLFAPTMDLPTPPLPPRGLNC